MSTSTSKYETALQRIDEAHSADPRLVPDPSPSPSPSDPTNTSSSGSGSSGKTIPYELHYAQKMTSYLNTLSPSASDLLKLAVRAQHLRRWEVPRDTYPATKIGYHSWRSALQRRQAEIVEGICLESGYSPSEAGRVASMVRKEELKAGDPDTQVLEDVACLVFLDERFEGFERQIEDQEKMVGILRRTWGKMSARAREEALKIEMSERGRELVAKALE